MVPFVGLIYSLMLLSQFYVELVPPVTKTYSPKCQQGDPAGVQDDQGHIQEASKDVHLDASQPSVEGRIQEGEG